MPGPAAILDVDGTLVDNNYQHALAWHLALRWVEIVAPIWRVHRAVGVGSDKTVTHLTGAEVEVGRGDEIRGHEGEIFGSMKDEVVAIEGATEFVRELKDRGRTVILASSGGASDIEGFVDLLELRDLVDGWTTSDDVDASKPDADLIEVALEQAGGGTAVMVGDTNWDVEASRRAGLETIGVRTGGSPRRLCSRLVPRPSTTLWTRSGESWTAHRWRGPSPEV